MTYRSTSGLRLMKPLKNGRWGVRKLLRDDLERSARSRSDAKARSAARRALREVPRPVRARRGRRTDVEAAQRSNPQDRDRCFRELGPKLSSISFVLRVAGRLGARPRGRHGHVFLPEAGPAVEVIEHVRDMANWVEPRSNPTTGVRSRAPCCVRTSSQVMRSTARQFQ